MAVFRMTLTVIIPITTINTAASLGKKYMVIDQHVEYNKNAFLLFKIHKLPILCWGEGVGGSRISVPTSYRLQQ